MVLELSLAIVSIGLSLVAARMLAPKGPKSLARDDKPTTLTNRGAFVPYLIGRRRVGAIFGWAGSRRVINEVVGTAGGKGSKKKKVYEKIFYEAAWHLLSVGPAYRLHKIMADGKVIFNGPIDSVTTPSGSTVDLGKQGSFEIYWGEHDQPTNAYLGNAGRVGITSRWPFLCYIVWRDKRLGSQARWPLIDYDLETRILETTQHAAGSPWIGAAADEGVNPAHAVDQLLFGKFPRGMELDPAEFDLQSLDDLSSVLESESIPVSVFAQDGQEAGATLAALMQDLGFMIAWDPTIGKYRFRAIREESNVTAIDEDVLLPPLPEIQVNHAERPVDKMVFSFSDRARNFRDMTLTIDDDGQGARLKHQRTRKIDLVNITSYAVATKVSERRLQEELAGGSVITFSMNRASRVLVAGQTITVPGYPGVYRVERTQIDPLSGEVKVHAIADIYGMPASGFEPEDSPTVAPEASEPEEDLDFTFIEIPSHISPGVQQVVVPRIRAHDQVEGADIWFSRDDTTYSHVADDSTIYAGGTLDADFASGTATLLTTGPTITAIGPDIGLVLDLSGDTANWRAGRQLAIIDEEIFYLQKVTALGGDSYRLDGLIRARFDTPKAGHAAGATVYIMDDDALRIEDGLLVPLADLYVKTQPKTGQSIALSLITPVSKSLIGKGIAPMRMESLRTENMANCFATGEDIPLKWAYRSTLTPRTGAGFQLSGTPIGLSAVEGAFTLEILSTGDVLKRTVSGLTTPAYDYTNAALVADFGGAEPSAFKVKVVNVNAGLSSPASEITVVRL